MRSTLYRALRTIDRHRPAAISPIGTLSRWACLTLEFIKTVQRVPKSHGAFACSAAVTKSLSGNCNCAAKVSKNEPQPEEQASLS